MQPGASAMLESYAIYFGVFVLVVGAVAALLYGLRVFAVTRPDPIARRMRTSIAPAGLDSEPATPSSPALQERGSLLDRALRPLAAVAKPTDEGELEGLRSRLSHGGYRGDRALYVYLLAKLLLCVAAAGGVVLYNSAQPQALERAALYTIVAMILGFYAPNAWLAGRVSERQSELGHALPDALDLLVTCVEAGLGLDMALNRVANELHLSSPLLATELLQSSLEMRAGLSRGDTMRRLAQRTGLDELKYLASIVVQTELFGTSIARSLRVMSDGMRIRRTQRAEQRAATVAVKMTLPLVLCILPSLFCVILGPAVVNIIRVMMPELAGGGVQQ